MQYSVDNLVMYDLEVNPNFFEVGFMLPDGTVYQYDFTDTDISRLQPLREFINWIEQSDHTLVGFNSANYDDVVLSEFLASPCVTTSYRTSVQLIEDRVPAWNFIQDIKSIDLIKILPNQMSLKKIGVCLGHKKLQELPVNPHANLTPEEMLVVAKYNINDLEITQKLTKEIHKELVLRRDLSIEHGIDLRSKGEAQVAEMILCEKMEQYTGLKKKKLKDTARNNVLQNPSFSVHVPTWFKDLDVAKYPTLQLVIDKGNQLFERQVYIIDYKLEEGALSDTAYVGDRWYKMGVGGLHSVDGPGTWMPEEDEVMIEPDVTSYYPNFMLSQNLSPRHWVIEGVDYFQAAFAPIVTQRVIAKEAGNKVIADRLKIIVNGTFGKTNDGYSALYDPYIMAAITVGGQLGLLTLIAMVSDVGGTTVSANTDGIVIVCKKEVESKVRDVVVEWEVLTALNMEYITFNKFCQKDVNNYIAVTDTGSVETKGIFNIPKMGKVDLRHTPNAQIVARSVSDYIAHGKDITLSITECQDIQEFLMTQQVKGDWSVKWRDVDLGKMVRFYKAINGAEIIKTPLHDGVKGNAGIVSNSSSCVPLPDLPDTFDTIVDIDYSWYIKEAKALYTLVTAPKMKYMNTVAYHLERAGMTPTLIIDGKNDRKTPKGAVDFSSIQSNQRLAVCTGRNFGVIAQRFENGQTFFFKVTEKYPAKTRATILKNEGFQFLFGSNIEVDAFSLLHSIDQDWLDEFYTENEIRKVRG